MTFHTHPSGASALRRELSARNLERESAGEREFTYGRVASVIYAADEQGGHGNFLSASFRRIQADSRWNARLGKTYSASARVPRSNDRWRGELECANSSDALLMNIFCYPGALRRPRLCALLGVDPGLRPDFGVRANIAMHRNEVDRTELDMRLGNLMLEAKLTETGLGFASRERVLRYKAVECIFDLEDLPWTPRGVAGYQVIRGVLAAEAEGCTFGLVYDARRADLCEVWFRVLTAVRSFDLRSRMKLLTWQEIASVLSTPVQQFLQEKYGICAP